MRLTYFCLAMALLIFTDVARSDGVFGLGVGTTTKYETEDDVVDFGGGLALGAEFDLILLRRLTLNLSGAYRKETAEADFELGGTPLPRVDADVQTMMISAGPRIRALDLTPLRLILGGGFTFGSLSLEYDVPAGLKDEESHQFTGHYFEGGLEFVLTSTSALRFMARETNYKTVEFETLGDKKVEVSQTQLMFQFLTYINF